MFGWYENKNDENRENKIKWKILFFIVWLMKENRKDWEKVFSPWPTFFILPNREKNVKKKVLWKHFYTNTLSHLPLIHDLMTFSHKSFLSLLPLFIITFTTLQRPGSLLSLSIFLFFSTWPNQVDTKYFAQLNLYVHYCNFYIIIIKIYVYDVVILYYLMNTNKFISYLLCNKGIIVNLYKLCFPSFPFSL